MKGRRGRQMTEQHLTIIAQINMCIAEYKQKYYKDPT